MLHDAQLRSYRDDGFLVLPGFVDTDACQRLRARALDLVAAWEPGDEHSVFTTDEQERASTHEFLDSAHGIWCFFETEAVDTAGRATVPKELSINKIGHAMHDLDPVFHDFTYTPELAAVAHDVGLDDPLALQSMYIFKQPGIGGEVGCHQDATFLSTEPMTVTGFWFAIEDATRENGCLWAAPGGHRGPLRKIFERTTRERTSNGRDGAGGDPSEPLTRFRELDPTPLPGPDDGLVPLEVPAGTLVVLHGLLPHWSDVNRSPRSRHAYTVHCIDGAADYPWWNWLQRPDHLPLRSLDRPGDRPTPTEQVHA